MQQAKITREMLEKAKEHGWYVSFAAREFGVAHTSMNKACKRFGISLPKHKFDPYGVAEKIPEVSNVKAKAWSASPAAIRRALAKIALAEQSRAK